MGKHTREPWIIAAFDGNDEYGAPILCRPYGETIGKFKLGHDRSRAVVCVNACSGIANPAALGELVEAVADLMLTAFDGGQTVNDPACVDAFALERLRAALADVQREGGTDETE